MKGMNTHPTGSKTLQNVSYYENYIFYYSIKTAACQSSRAADERTVRADIKLQQISRRTEYLKLEGTHEDHLQSDFWLHTGSTKFKLYVQECCPNTPWTAAAWCNNHCPRVAYAYLPHPLGKNLFQSPNPTLPDAAPRRSPRSYCYYQRAGISACPSTPFMRKLLTEICIHPFIFS